MHTPKNRKEKAAITKKRIFDTAVHLIKNKGYNNVTVSEICNCAGIAKGSFYVHYNSKEDIIRESYYTDMGTYIEQHYFDYTKQYPESSPVTRIIHFLYLELEFAVYAGYELTCLAYSLNLGACIPGPSEHFEKRTFSKILYHEILSAIKMNLTDFSCDELFVYLESIVRGIMSTWCFSNNLFNIRTTGKQYICHAVRSLFQE